MRFLKLEMEKGVFLFYWFSFYSCFRAAFGTGNCSQSKIRGFVGSFIIYPIKMCVMDPSWQSQYLGIAGKRGFRISKAHPLTSQLSHELEILPFLLRQDSRKNGKELSLLLPDSAHQFIWKCAPKSGLQ